MKSTKFPLWLKTLLAVAVFIGLALVYPVTHKVEPRVETVAVVNTPEYINPLRIGRLTLNVAIADTDASRELGLSDTKPLEASQGMLFVFPEPQNVGFWMKDMKYPLDIIWIDADKKIVGAAEELDPSTYPKTYSPGVPVQYILEVESGFMKKYGIDVGTKVEW